MPTEAKEPPKTEQEEATAPPPDAAASAEVVAHRPAGVAVGELLSRLPFVSSLLPPRPTKRDSGALPDWVLPAAVALLLLANGDNDILPLLLLLLLWE